MPFFVPFYITSGFAHTGRERVATEEQQDVTRERRHYHRARLYRGGRAHGCRSRQRRRGIPRFRQQRYAGRDGVEDAEARCGRHQFEAEAGRVPALPLAVEVLVRRTGGRGHRLERRRQRHLSQLRPVGPASIHHTVRAVRVARAVAVLESVRVELVHPAGDGAAPEAHQAAPEGVADLLHIHLRVLPVPAGAERAALASATTAGVPHRRAEPLGRAGSVPPETGGHGAVPDVVRGGCRMGHQEQDRHRDIPAGPLPFRHSLALHYSIGLN